MIIFFGYTSPYKFFIKMCDIDIDNQDSTILFRFDSIEIFIRVPTIIDKVWKKKEGGGGVDKLIIES